MKRSASPINRRFPRAVSSPLLLLGGPQEHDGEETDQEPGEPVGPGDRSQASTSKENSILEPI